MYISKKEKDLTGHESVFYFVQNKKTKKGYKLLCKIFLRKLVLFYWSD